MQNDKRPLAAAYRRANIALHVPARITVARFQIAGPCFDPDRPEHISHCGGIFAADQDRHNRAITQICHIPSLLGALIEFGTHDGSWMILPPLHTLT